MQPAGSPTNRPSSQPSGDPTRQPSSQPSGNPTSGPTLAPCKPGKYIRDKISCVVCPTGKYSSEPDSRACIACAAGKFAPIAGLSACQQVPPGSFGSRAGLSTASLCGPGYFAGAGASSCGVCLPGSYASTPGNAVCLPCPKNTYSDQRGTVNCVACPFGRVTPLVGGASETDCLSAAPNFASGTLFLVLGAYIALEYIVFGRFYLASLVRNRVVVSKQTDSFKDFSLRMGRKLEMSVIDQRIRTARKAMEEIMSPFYKHVFFWKLFVDVCILVLFIFLAAIGTLLGTIFFFAGELLEIVFESLLVSNQAQELFGAATFQHMLKNLVASTIAQLINFHVPSFIIEIIRDFLLSIQVVFTWLSTLKIDFSSLGVTCVGAKAPIVLLVNVSVLGLVIIVVLSQSQLFRSVVLGPALGTYTSFVLSSEFRKDRKTFGEWFDFVRAVFALPFTRLFSSVAIFPRVIRLVMKEVQFAPFQTIAFTPFCDAVPGLIGFDSFLAYTTAFSGYILMLPVIYEVSRICCPFDPIDSSHTDKMLRRSARMSQKRLKGTQQEFDPCCCLSTPKKWARTILTWLAPDLFLANFTNSLEKSLRKTVKFESVSAIAIYSGVLAGDASEVVSYWSLLQCEAIELAELAGYRNLESEPYILLFFTILLGLFPVGHVLTHNGLRTTKVVFLRFLVFVFASFGIWTSSTEMGYQFQNQVSQFSQDVVKDECKNEESNWNEINSIYSEALVAMIAPRAILLQLVPGIGKIWSNYSIKTAATPILPPPSNQKSTCGLFADKMFFPLLIHDPLSRAQKEEHGRFAHKVWLNHLSALRSFFLNSRLLRLALNVYKSVVVLLILQPSNGPALYFMLFILLVDAFINALGWVLVLGKIMNIKDLIDFGHEHKFSIFKKAYEFEMKSSDNLDMVKNPHLTNKVELSILRTDIAVSQLTSRRFSDGSSSFAKDRIRSNQHRAFCKSEDFTGVNPLVQSGRISPDAATAYNRFDVEEASQKSGPSSNQWHHNSPKFSDRCSFVALDGRSSVCNSAQFRDSIPALMGDLDRDHDYNETYGGGDQRVSNGEQEALSVGRTDVDLASARVLDTRASIGGVGGVVGGVGSSSAKHPPDQSSVSGAECGPNITLLAEPGQPRGSVAFSVLAASGPLSPRVPGPAVNRLLLSGGKKREAVLADMRNSIPARLPSPGDKSVIGSVQIERDSWSSRMLDKDIYLSFMRNSIGGGVGGRGGAYSASELLAQPLGHDRRVTLGPDYGLASLFGGGSGGVSENSHPAQSQSRRVTLGPDYGLAGLFAEQPSPATARQAAAAVAADAGVEAMSARMLDDDARRLFILSRASIGNSPSSSGGGGGGGGGAERPSQVEFESRHDSPGSVDHGISTLRAPAGRGSLSVPVTAAASSPASAGPRRLSVSGAPAAAHRRDTIPAQWLSPPPPRRGEAQDQDQDPPTPAPRRPVLSIRLSSVRHDQSPPSRPRPQRQLPPPHPSPPRGLRPLRFSHRRDRFQDEHGPDNLH